MMKKQGWEKLHGNDRFEGCSIGFLLFIEKKKGLLWVILFGEIRLFNISQYWPV